ncbi:MAG: hypothetical protein M3O28_09420 [Actinomycetota bacterium]|nr:hypothetical protein [Actinomycetota bacterium]
MISRLRAFGAFWYDFVVGDDWRVAIGVVVALAATYLIAQNTHATVWWVMPVAVVILLPVSLLRAVRASKRTKQ